MAKLITIAAVAIDGTIGIDNEIPWKISEDLKHFRETTMGGIMIVGYNTYITLPPKAFEGRDYIVISKKNKIINKEINVYNFKSFDVALHLIRDNKTSIEKAFIIGGAMLYDSTIEYSDEVIITWINKKYENGNKFFPINKLFDKFTPINNPDWILSNSGLEYKIVTYKKI